METKPISNRMYSLLVLFDMHSDYFSRALEGISDKDAHNRLNKKANHVAWLTGSLVQQRYELLALLGTQMKQEADELFKDHQGIKDNSTYPALAHFEKDWKKVSPLLRDALMKCTDEKLDSLF